jgi:hypothetical protein
MTPEPHPEPRYTRFHVRYQTGVAFESHCPGGATLREVAIEHPLAVVEAIAGSQIKVPEE